MCEIMTCPVLRENDNGESYLAHTVTDILHMEDSTFAIILPYLQK